MKPRKSEKVGDREKKGKQAARVEPERKEKVGGERKEEGRMVGKWKAGKTGEIGVCDDGIEQKEAGKRPVQKKREQPTNVL